MARSVVATDDFEAYTVGSFPTANWSDLDNNNGQIRVVAGKGVNNAFSSNATMRRSAGTYSTEQYAEGTLAAITGTQSGMKVGVTVRNSADVSPGQDCYAIYLDEQDASQALVIARINNDSVTVLATQSSTAIVAGDKISIEATGTGATVTLNGYINTTLQPSLTVADSSASRITAAGRPGVYGHTSGAVYITDWGGGDVTAVPQAQPLVIPPQGLPFIHGRSGLVWRGAVPPNWENELMSMRQLFVLP